MKGSFKHLLTLLLAFTLVFTHAVTPVYAETGDEPNEADPGNSTQLEMEDLDPSTLNVKKQGTDLVKEDPEENDALSLDQNAVVRVSIILDGDSVTDAGYSAKGIAGNSSAVSYRNKLKKQQANVTKAIEKQLKKELNVKWNLTLTINAISAEVKVSDINKIKMVSGVKNVILENRYDAPITSKSDPQTANTSAGMVGAQEAWSAGYTGAGSRIAIIDTGLDIYHDSFNPDAFDYAISQLDYEPVLLTEDDVNSLASQLNVPGAYVDSKVPFAFNYVDMNYDITHSNDRQGEHGSHVAGIAAANSYIETENGFEKAIDTVMAVGMAPDAQLIVMKVFGTGGGAYDSDYFTALEDAMVLGCDVANLSLGSGSPGFTFSDYYQDELNRLNSDANSNMVVAISAGNVGAFADNTAMGVLYAEDVSMHSGGSPGSFINSLCVASADNIGTTGKPLQFGDLNVYYNESVSEARAPMASLAGTQEFVYIDALGSVEDYATVNDAVSLEGKIVIINRGGLTFVEKGNNAVEFNPAALIVANNQPGSIGMLLDDCIATFPMITISFSDANAIKAAYTAAEAGGIKYYTGSVNVTDAVTSDITGTREDATVSSFSSWGIPGSLIMKPEITAPGGNIYSVFGTSNDTNGNPQGGVSEYEMMSGTSMAAPHIAGLTAVVAEYLRQNDLSEMNSELAENYSVRAIVQSLLMSTATPMKNDGQFVSILQQGAGLAEVSKAVSAPSVVMVGPDDDTLTAYTGAAADGKVKVEFGDDLLTDRKYIYSFTIYNLSDTDLEYKLNTEMFTQDIAYDGQNLYMLPETWPINTNVEYEWSPVDIAIEHDVDKDGDTDKDDAQALLDYITGAVDGTELDLDAGEMDKDGKITSHDAYLLLIWTGESEELNVVPAHDSRTVTVTITIDDEMMEYFENGAYIEGFTTAESSSYSEEGVDLSHKHSIPLLGFYGNWGDPSMFDNNSIVDFYYGNTKYPYSFMQYNTNYYNATGKELSLGEFLSYFPTNCMVIKYNGVNSIMYGNPYYIEDEFPADKLAVNGNDVLNSINYTLLRSAGATGYAATLLDDYNGNVKGILDLSIDKERAVGMWYSEKDAEMKNIANQTYPIGVKPSEYGLEEGDVFRVGYYAIPEYLAMLLYGDFDSQYGGITDGNGLQFALRYDLLGKGSYIGYDFKVDNTAPKITKATLSEDNSTITIEAEDNFNLAYVAIISVDGEEYFYEAAPGEDKFTVEIPAEDIVTDAKGYVAVFAADYAANETAVALKVNDEEGMDPYTVASITVSPKTLHLYVGNEEDLLAKVSPITADQTVVWESDDPAVATVDDTGRVVGVSKGQTVVRVSAASDETAYDECVIYVEQIDADFNAIVWDVDASQFISSFNMKSLPTWNKLHSNGFHMNLASTLAISDTDVYVGSLDTSTAEGNLYLTDLTEAEPELELVAPCAYWSTDMALVSETYAAYFPYYFYVEGTYAILSSFEPEAMDESGTEYVNIPYAVIPITNGEYLSGIALKSELDMSTYQVSYYVLDENGVIYEFTYDLMNNKLVSGSVVVQTGITTSFLYQSLYADENYIYWSCYEDGDTTSHMVVYDINNKVLYTDAGNFGEGVWPVQGLYRTSQATADQGGSIPTITLEPLKSSILDEKHAEFDARLTAELNKFSKLNKVAPKSVEEAPVTEEVVETIEGAATPAGEMIENKLNVAKFPVRMAIKGTSTTDEEGTATIVLTEDEDATNGFCEITYDAKNLKNPTVTPEEGITLTSYTVDEENGVIKFAYATEEAVKAYDKVATVTFDAPCEDSDVTITTTERNDETDLEEETTVTVEGVGHQWSEPEWIWSKDHKEATAKFVCENNEEHVVEITEKAVIEETPATEEKEGKRVYTVTVTGPDGEKYTTTYTEVIPAGVDTGDASNIVLWSSVFGGSLVVIAAILLAMKKKGYFTK
ncbi:MAG: S8 family serine peptidase [Erysipelotrichaceae bacterium]|nr:S8 family serine peptidase [Erysipelotrichaceae bacterium]